MGSSASIAWPNTVLNTIVAESLDYVADELEKAVGAKPTPAKLQLGVIAVLKQLIKEHKRVIFDGDNYSEEWHAEAERRGLPEPEGLGRGLCGASGQEERGSLQEVRGAESGRARLPHPHRHREVHQAARHRGRDHGLDGAEPDPAGRAYSISSRWRRRSRPPRPPESTAPTPPPRSGASSIWSPGSEPPRPRSSRPRRITTADPIKHAAQISRELKPAMAELRDVVDTLETLIAADLWPLPTYRDLLFLK